MGKGGPGPPEKSQKYRVFFSNTGPDPPENHKAINWRFSGGPMMARLYWHFDPPSPINKTKTLSKLDLLDPRIRRRVMLKASKNPIGLRRRYV